MFKQNNIKFLIMDTYKKNDENLTSFLDANKIQTFIKECKKKKIDVGLAGRLEQKHIKILRKFDPFVMGFRSAICDGFDRKILCKKSYQRFQIISFLIKVKLLRVLEHVKMQIYMSLCLKNCKDNQHCISFSLNNSLRQFVQSPKA